MGRSAGPNGPVPGWASSSDCPSGGNLRPTSLPNSPMNMLPFTKAPRLPNIGLTSTPAACGASAWKRARSWSVGLGICTASPLLRDRLDQVADALLGQVLGDVGLAHHADQVVTVDHRQPPHLVLAHGSQDLLDRVVGPDGDRLALGQVAGAGRGRVTALGEAPDHDVAVGHHALEPVVLAADGQRPDVQVAHLAGGIGEGLVLADALDAAGHDVACSGHVRLRGPVLPRPVRAGRGFTVLLLSGPGNAARAERGC